MRFFFFGGRLEDGRDLLQRFPFSLKSKKSLGIDIDSFSVYLFFGLMNTHVLTID